MPDDPTSAAPDLAEDLRRYFALTAAVAVPASVRRLDARVLVGRRPLAIGGRALAALLGGAGAVATAAIVVLIAGHQAGAPGSTASSFAGNGAAGLAAPASALYPGVDLTALPQSGVTVSSPSGYGLAHLTPIQAQAAATAAQVNAEGPGPAVLVWAQFRTPAAASTCLCWIVDVPIRGGVVNDSRAVARPGMPPAQTVLVFVDAATGRVVDTLSAPGIP